MPPTAKREVDLERAHLRVDLVRAAEVDRRELAEDLVPLRDVALVQAVVRLDRRREIPSSSRSAGFSSRGPDLDEVRHRPPTRGGNRAEHILGPSEPVPRGEQAMAYSVPDLPYPFDALEPHIDARTMEIHHDKHHAAYVDEPERGARGHRVGGPADRRGAREPRDHPRGQAQGRTQQRRRPRQPHALLGDHGPGRRRRAGGRAGRGDRTTPSAASRSSRPQ